jgi:hypothetical protein
VPITRSLTVRSPMAYRIMESKRTESLCRDNVRPPSFVLPVGALKALPILTTRRSPLKRSLPDQNTVESDQSDQDDSHRYYEGDRQHLL